MNTVFHKSNEEISKFSQSLPEAEKALKEATEEVEQAQKWLSVEQKMLEQGLYTFDIMKIQLQHENSGVLDVQQKGKNQEPVRSESDIGIAIIEAMTEQQKRNPKLFFQNAKQKLEVANKAQATVEDVHRLLDKFVQFREMVQTISKLKKEGKKKSQKTKRNLWLLS
eukprot:TRINITY_DN6279_c0_g1_i1.p1 TRINITY_DN6279_c0_g1~~TRINITY_DN6279_c0_g1_i1.p1  ORF type:complete len:167 (-),score=41.37 TRINITY_DN6279_c0_g1_i1:171-671(-)